MCAASSPPDVRHAPLRLGLPPCPLSILRRNCAAVVAQSAGVATAARPPLLLPPSILPAPSPSLHTNLPALAEPSTSVFLAAAGRHSLVRTPGRAASLPHPPVAPPRSFLGAFFTTPGPLQNNAAPPLPPFCGMFFHPPTQSRHRPPHPSPLISTGRHWCLVACPLGLPITLPPPPRTLPTPHPRLRTVATPARTQLPLSLLLTAPVALTLKPSLIDFLPFPPPQPSPASPPGPSLLGAPNKPRPAHPVLSPSPPQ